MRLGQLLLNVGVIIGTLAVLYGGYLWYQAGDLKTYAELIQANPGQTPKERLAHFADAPAMVCTVSASDFGASLSGRVYTAPGQIRYEYRDAGSTETRYQLFNDEGLYAWADSSDFVSHLALEAVYQEPPFDTTVLKIDCESWKYNAGMFDLPLGRSIKEESSLR